MLHLNYLIFLLLSKINLMILILTIIYIIKMVLKNFKMLFLNLLFQILTIIMVFNLNVIIQIHN